MELKSKISRACVTPSGKITNFYSQKMKNCYFLPLPFSVSLNLCKKSFVGLCSLCRSPSLRRSLWLLLASETADPFTLLLSFTLAISVPFWSGPHKLTPGWVNHSSVHSHCAANICAASLSFIPSTQLWPESQAVGGRFPGTEVASRFLVALKLNYVIIHQEMLHFFAFTVT